MSENTLDDPRCTAVLKNIIFVVVKPIYLGNIGAVARAMKNFAFSELRLVSPPKNYKDAEARKMAVGAFDILKQATLFETLAEALEDVSVCVGTTSGKQRKLNPVPLPELSNRLVDIAYANKIAFVIGDERDGLRQEDLNRCHHIVTIPTSDQLPSLNLAQAVCIIGYEMSSRVLSGVCAKPAEAHSTGKVDDELVRMFRQISDSVNFSRTFNEQQVAAEFRQLWQRIEPTKREADLLRGILIRLNQHLGLKSDV